VADSTLAWTSSAVGHLRAGATVASVAESLGYSERQLHRRSLAAFGYGLKTSARVLRMSRALDLVRSGGELATVAVAAGYSDQRHFARDVKLLAGVPISEPEPAGPDVSLGPNRRQQPIFRRRRT